MSGKFIVFEGGDLSGKSTQAKLLTKYLGSKGVNTLLVREPGGTKIAEKIRRIILNKKNVMTPECELFLYMAARAQLVNEKIKPALRAGKWVISDRFLYSSAAYQGFAGKIGMDKVFRMGELITKGLPRAIVFILDIDPRIAFKRSSKRLDRMESKGLSYHKQVRRGFLKLAKMMPNVYLIDASRSVDAVHKDITRIIEALNPKYEIRNKLQ